MGVIGSLAHMSPQLLLRICARLATSLRKNTFMRIPLKLASSRPDYPGEQFGNPRVTFGFRTRPPRPGGGTRGVPVRFESGCAHVMVTGAQKHHRYFCASDLAQQSRNSLRNKHICAHSVHARPQAAVRDRREDYTRPGGRISAQYYIGSGGE